MSKAVDRRREKRECVTAGRDPEPSLAGTYDLLEWQGICMETVTVTDTLDADIDRIRAAVTDVGPFMRAAQFDEVSVDGSVVRITNQQASSTYGSESAVSWMACWFAFMSAVVSQLPSTRASRCALSTSTSTSVSP